MTTISLRVRLVIPVVVATMGCLLIGCDGAINLLTGPGRPMATEADVVTALETTPYEITYRKVPRLEGYEVIAGRARSRNGGVVDFSVVLRKAGWINNAPESRLGGGPQFPVVRYAETQGSITGNMNVVTQEQGHYVVERSRFGELGWSPTSEEANMGIELGIALNSIFPPNIEGGP